MVTALDLKSKRKVILFIGFFIAIMILVLGAVGVVYNDNRRKLYHEELVKLKNLTLTDGNIHK